MKTKHIASALFAILTSLCLAGTPPKKKQSPNKSISYNGPKCTHSPIEVKGTQYVERYESKISEYFRIRVKAENLPSGQKIINEKIPLFMDFLGLSYHSSLENCPDVHWAIYPCMHDIYRVKSQDVFQEYLSHIKFFNDRREGAFSGQFNQLFLGIEAESRKWEDGYVIFDMKLRLGLSGIYKFNDEKSITGIYCDGKELLVNLINKIQTTPQQNDITITPLN